MEKHFLGDMMKEEGEQTFLAEPWYNRYGDCIVFQLGDEAFVAERIDELLTIYHSVVDMRCIGYQVKGVAAIIRKLGIEGLRVCSEADNNGVTRVSIAALLLAAYEDGPRTLKRRMAYATVMDCPVERRSIPANEFQPA